LDAGEKSLASVGVLLEVVLGVDVLVSLLARSVDKDAAFICFLGDWVRVELGIVEVISDLLLGLRLLLDHMLLRMSLILGMIVIELLAILPERFALQRSPSERASEFSIRCIEIPLAYRVTSKRPTFLLASRLLMLLMILIISLVVMGCPVSTRLGSSSSANLPLLVQMVRLLTGLLVRGFLD
jgi:hypothetical protein